MNGKIKLFGKLNLEMALWVFQKNQQTPPWGVIGCHTPLAEVIPGLDRVLNFYTVTK